MFYVVEIVVHVYVLVENLEFDWDFKFWDWNLDSAMVFGIWK